MHTPLTATVALVLSLTGLALPAASAAASRVPVRIVHVSGGGWIDWGDAGIGAAAGAGITLLGLGCALAVSQRRTHPTAGRGRPAADGGSPRTASQSTQKRSGDQ